MRQSKATLKAIENAFNARSLAIVGASAVPGKYGYMTLDSVIKGGYTGKIYPVNRKGGEMMGLVVYPSLDKIPEAIELAVIVVPAQFVPDTVSEAAKKGAKAALVLSAGFREAGRLDLEVALTNIAEEYGIRIMGPNIQGINYLPNKLCAMFFPVIKAKGPLAIITQSGTVTAALSEWAEDEGIGISGAVNLGNQVDLCESDYIEFFAADAETKAIVLYLEGVKNGKGFLEVIKNTSAEKPICILKGGRSMAGQKTAASHTGSLAGNREIFAAACRQFDVFYASDLESLYDGAKALALLPPLQGNRVLMVSTSGGAGVLAADALDNSGVALPPLPVELKRELEKLDFPPYANFANPLDLTSLQAKHYEEVITLIDKYNAFDLFLIGFGDPVVGGAETIMQLAPRIKRPLAVVYFGGGEEEKRGRVELQSMGIPVFPTPERAIKGIAAAVRTSSFSQKTEKGSENAIPPSRDTTIKKVDVPSRFLPEPETIRFLKEYNIPYPEHGLATNPQQAIEIADMIGYPVVLKIVSSNVSHKSDVGGVALDLHNSEDVSEAYEMILSHVRSTVPDSDINDVLICKQVEDGLEVIIGSVDDPIFGPTIMFGLGGIYTELLRDVAFRVAPLTKKDAGDMIREIKGYPILSGIRGQKRIDIGRLVDMLISVSNLVMNEPGIKELDLNPVRIYENGIIALDARMMLKD